MATYGIKKKKKSGPDLAQSGPGYGNVPGMGEVGYKQFYPTIPTTTTPTPAATAPTPTFSFSPDAAFTDTEAALIKQRDEARSGYVARAARLLRDYGYGGGPDAYSTSFAVDQSNPYSKAKLLEKSFKEAQTGNRNSFAARGQGTSGALMRAQSRAENQYAQGSNTLRTSLADALADLRGADTSLDSAFGKARADALAEAIRRAAETRPAVDPAAGGAPAPTAPSGPSFKQVMADKLKGPNGEQLHVTNKGTYYIRKSDGKAIYIKRN